ncbi:MAG: PQQ-binding-like beta-propeller repeat protein [Verrucomicrobiota bacterium]|nr:PQQ-binding-like beta-propeller repeat protein [Verrucomicrobiota bacterium]
MKILNCFQKTWTSVESHEFIMLKILLRLSFIFLSVSSGLILPFSTISAERGTYDWPQWLGSNRDAIWREDGILDSFPIDGPDLRWRTPIGSGYSGPSVSDGRVFVMDRLATKSSSAQARLLHDGQPPRNINFVRKLLPGKERLVCLNEADGKILWHHEWDCPYTTVAAYAIGPRATPTIDGDRVYALGAEGNLFAIQTKNGKVVWSHDFKKKYDLKIPEWGTASHPLVHEDILICIVGGSGSTCVAYDKRTGRELWRALSASQPGYCPPVVRRISGFDQLLIWHSDALESLNPKTGDVYWSVPIKPTYAMAIGQPVVEGNRIYVMGYNRISGCVEVSKEGTAAKLLWKGSTRRGIPGVHNTAFIQNGLVYACGPGGRYGCIRLSDGEYLWSTFAPAEGNRRATWANVFTVRNGNRFFLANDYGELIIANLSATGYKELSRAKLIEPTHQVAGRTLVWSHPAFANRSVYLRNDREIRCYSLAKPND